MRVYHDKSFKELTTFKIGGPIKNLYYPSTTEELATLLSKLHEFHVIGAGSKILASDGPFDHVICTKHLNQLSFEENMLRVGAGAYAPYIATKCARHGLSGTEFLIDIPATIGGAVVMNAGFMGCDMSQICVSVKYVTFGGEVKETTDIAWDRRWCNLQDMGIVTEAMLQLAPRDRNKIEAVHKKYHKIRVANQPQGVASAGGIFINHRDLPSVLKTLPYLRYGDAEIVERCQNFIVNHGAATFEEVLHLINLIEEHALILGIFMNREIKIIGDL